ncbi:putative pentatricopeptide repeat-containing protein At3g23330 [Typha latifolia]|uniref:putative pentatricopeptide repeat-containing protein At3g23330 n=1 Tax=Typha latifolia TaxID=4733 RepID=UPI003C2F7ADA
MMLHIQLPQPSPTRRAFQGPLLPNGTKSHGFKQLHRTSSTSSQSTIQLKTNSQSSSSHSLPSSQRKTKSWDSRIHLQFGRRNYRDCITSYYQMVDDGVFPSHPTFSLVLKACSFLNDIRALRLLHNDALRFGLDSVPSVAAAILDGYVKCGSPELASQLFDRMPHRDVISWIIVISASYKSGNFGKAINYFREMVEGVAPDEVALVSILSVATQLTWLPYGLEVHGYLTRRCFRSGEALISSLVKMYAKLGRIHYAVRIVSKTKENSAIAWTTLMMGYMNSNNMYGALYIFQRMISLGIEPTERTISCALRAASHLGLIRLGIQIHGYILKGPFELDNHTLSSLIDMYSICGMPTQLCRKIFDQMKEKDVVSWTTMIMAYNRWEDGHASLQLFDEMQTSGVSPDSVAFTAVLSACRSSGMLHEGLRLFNSMIVDYGINPTEEHFACLRNLIAKDGRLKEAYEAIESMAIKDQRDIWQAFLGACRVHGNENFSEIAASKMLKIDQSESSAKGLSGSMMNTS